MTISVNQQVDYLWKKIGYNVSKTDVTSIKDATNERIPSSPFIPGDKIWSQTDLIPSVIPSSTDSILHIHSDSHGSTVVCQADSTATVHRTWLTNLTDWVPVDFGSTYQIKVYLDVAGSTTPQTTGTRLYAAGGTVPGDSVGTFKDEWFFDYESGVLNFIGDNLPNVDFTNKAIYICGARYIGHKGLGVFTTGTFGNLTLSGNTVSSSGGIVFDPAGNATINVSGATLTNLGAPTNPSDAVSLQYLQGVTSPLHPNQIYQGASSATITDTGLNGTMVVNIDGTTAATFTRTNTTIGNLTITGSNISNNGNITLSPSSGNSIILNTDGAVQIPHGTTASRPTTGLPGYIRFNTTSGILEIHDGTSWISTQAQIGSQVVEGDGVANIFQLNQNSYAGNMLVMINGVVQLPFTAYNVAGNIISFAEPPKAGDTIEVRYISQSISDVATAPAALVVDSLNLNVGTSQTVLDTFSSVGFRSAKYTLSVVGSNGEAMMAEVVVIHNGASANYIENYHVTTGATAPSLTYSASISTGICTFSASSTQPSTQVKLHKMYFTV
jgi:hypothetical protein